MPPLGHRQPDRLLPHEGNHQPPSQRPRRPRRLAGLITLPLLALALAAGPARAGSSTADSTWDSSNALQRAMEGVPAGAKVTRTNCQDIALPGNNDRYRCTVFYEQPMGDGTVSTPTPPGNPSP